MPPPNPPPHRSSRAMALIAGAILIIVAVIFVGMNLSHMQTKGEHERGDIAPSDQPQSPTDLTREPVRNGS